MGGGGRWAMSSQHGTPMHILQPQRNRNQLQGSGREMPSLQQILQKLHETKPLQGSVALKSQGIGHMQSSPQIQKTQHQHIWPSSPLRQGPRHEMNNINHKIEPQAKQAATLYMEQVWQKNGKGSRPQSIPANGKSCNVLWCLQPTWSAGAHRAHGRPSQSGRDRPNGRVQLLRH